ncbi:FbpB family small basic protein [Virgibacillus phasianinus]|uniref:FbpB family small basic protein n=1 Tax=Virgibacillus phasianinus TaxID=2017483 RepID=UPI002481B785|nr:FbpB family small basic protein [Virgibacillus phasianinus]
MGILLLKKEWISISLKRRLSYNELVSQNRKEIMQDQSVLEKIESKFELKYQQLKENKEA